MQKVEELYEIVGDARKTGKMRKRALDGLIQEGANEELRRIVCDPQKNDWIRKEAINGLIGNGANRELRWVLNEVEAEWIRKLVERGLGREGREEYVDIPVRVLAETKELMEDMAAKSNRDSSDVARSLIEDGRRVPELIDEIKTQGEKEKGLKAEIEELKDLKVLNERLRRERINLSERTKSLERDLSVMKKVFGYYNEHVETLKSIIREFDYEFMDRVKCPNCGSETTLITDYELSEGKIRATKGYCLKCALVAQSGRASD